MPRPTDTYTHAQFENLVGENDISRCRHCNAWKGTNKVLSRKKEHLLKCTPYLTWRAAGNGQDLLPHNTYNRRDASGIVLHSPRENGQSDHEQRAESSEGGLISTPMGYKRSTSINLLKYFDEFWDDAATQKCMRVRCLACGFVRAKNSTRQIEHLLSCEQFANSSEGLVAFASGEIKTPANYGKRPAASSHAGTAPISSLSLQDQTPVNNQSAPCAPAANPSLTNFLLRVNEKAVEEASQQAFLAKAGAGSLSAQAFDTWLGQQIHISKALVPFIGNMIGKIRIPETQDLQRDPYFRTIDLLVSSVTNMKKELEFIESTKRKYSLASDISEPVPAVRGLVDLFANASCAQASLLEGLVCLFAIEHLFCTSFQYASKFNDAPPREPISSYSLPSYLTGLPSTSSGPYVPTETTPPHILAIHEAFIPNWSSPNFVRFVGACKEIVDELANTQTSGNGRIEMVNCERSFKQVVWLWNQVWPNPSRPEPPSADSTAQTNVRENEHVSEATNDQDNSFLVSTDAASGNNGQNGGSMGK
ncbi:heme oxygenase-like protein [Acrodontium crateriforme]|uniref:Heme oxygenase-like protein n=1 Tax=Acrodontium crateriforme TaxID=150365 RepID=A0AAQ3M831_9PEZI|nr:heme oxygenase-like protein [Acrodontium crateriforme]